MTRILSFDQSTKNNGWALYDTDSPVSAIRCGSFVLNGDTISEKIRSLRHHVRALIKEHKPDFCVFEAPADDVRSYEKKTTDMYGETTVESAINAKSSLMLHDIAGALEVIILGCGVECERVRPQTWQSIVPKKIKGKGKGKEASKDRVRQFCDLLNIVGRNADARDGGIISLWAGGRSQVLKLNERAREVA